MFEFIIKKEESNQKILKFAKKNLNNLSLSLIHKIFRKKDVKVNGKRVDEEYVLQNGDKVNIYVPSYLNEVSTQKDYRKMPITFSLVYEDENILIINKPAGLLVTASETEKYRTVANQVITYLSEKGEYEIGNKSFVPAPVHRIDRNTSGLVIIAKNMIVSQYLTELFRNREGIEKEYSALAKGKISEPGEIDLPLLKDAKTAKVTVSRQYGLKALTLYAPIDYYGDFTLLNIKILTGRTHQIRVHMSSINHPIVGDAKYGDFELNRLFKAKYNFENQFLHATKISFSNLKEPLAYLSYQTFIAPLSAKQETLLAKLKEK